MKRIFLTLLLLLSFASGGAAQSGSNYYNPKDDQFRLLGLRRAKEAFEFAEQEFNRKKELFEQNLLSKLEFDQSRNRFADAEVNYQQALLAVIFEKQYVAIKNAVKFQSKDGRKTVRITLENTSGGSGEFKKLINVDDELFSSLQPEVINDVYVSLLNDDDAIISAPYEAKIEKLIFGEPQSLTFSLLQDLDAVKVNLIYGSGTQSSKKIYLRKDASVDKAMVQSEQFSQEVELGGQASFGLSLELFSGSTNTFKLEVANLPTQINRYFVDPGSSARLSYFKFNESANTRRANLQVYLPDRPTEEVVIDRSIPFYVLAIPQDQVASVGDVRSKQWSESELEALGIGYVRLELVPRGIGKLLVRAPQLYYSIRADETVRIPVDLVNDGTRRLDNVEVDADVPINWRKSFEPKVVESLGIASEQRALVEITPAANVAVGKYEIRVRTTSLSDDQPIAGEDKTVTVEIQPEANILGTAVIILLILGLVLGIVIFGVKLSRR
ncbi:MAG: hypothetical protein H6695_03505 [Deferribacteres bacterium]|nr:hypothetical protein [candidate division KSB1 bacterium]MCB9509215.1 hypothetical protein [Deferribacteres bacterium]